jgi:hypothetical protein
MVSLIFGVAEAPWCRHPQHWWSPWAGRTRSFSSQALLVAVISQRPPFCWLSRDVAETSIIQYISNENRHRWHRKSSNIIRSADRFEERHGDILKTLGQAVSNCSPHPTFNGLRGNSQDTMVKHHPTGLAFLALFSHHPILAKVAHQFCKLGPWFTKSLSWRPRNSNFTLVFGYIYI